MTVQTAGDTPLHENNIILFIVYMLQYVHCCNAKVLESGQISVDQKIYTLKNSEYNEGDQMSL